MKTLIAIIILLTVLSFTWYIQGGKHLNYLRENGITKAQEICDENSKIVYEGYQRAIFSGFGGRVWYMCSIKNIPIQFYIARRINNPELQVYNFQQILTFPTEFTINN